MRIAFLNTFEKHGGAGLAAFRLEQAIKKYTSLEIDNYAQFKGDFHKYNLKNIAALSRIGLEKFFLKIQLKNHSDLYKFETGRYGLPLYNNPKIVRSDIIHFHWVQQGFLSLKGIRKLAASKPVVWTMHDMWAFTGGCCYSNDCTRYRESCGNCPFLKNPGEADLSYKIWKEKEKLFSNRNITLVGPSRWITLKAEDSGLGKKAKIYHIPNPVDTELFSPGDRKKTRSEYNIDDNEFVLLFGAQNLDDNRKGFGILEKALVRLVQSDFKEAEKIRLLLFGATDHQEKFSKLPVKVLYTGIINNPEELKKLYNVADWYIHPALADNLPNTVVESVSCGTPVLGFNSGGINEIITSDFNGLIAPGINSDELARFIIKAFQSQGRMDKLRMNARKFALDTYSMEKVAGAYYDLYRQVLSG